MNKLFSHTIPDYLRNVSPQRLAWLWLLVGFALLPFTFYQTVIPLAAWLAPVFLLRFERTTARGTWVTFRLIALVYMFADLIAGRGLPFSLLGFLGNMLLKSLLWGLPYAADRLLARRLHGWARTLVFPLAFTTVDWLISLTVISSTGSPAYSQSNLALMQVISVTGMWAITFLITWFAALANALWEADFRWQPVRSQLITFAGVLGAVLIFGGFRLAVLPPSTITVKAAAVTIDPDLARAANTSFDWGTFYKSTDGERAAVRPKFQAAASDLLAKSETGFKDGAKIVSWQESSAIVLEEDKQGILSRAGSLAKQYNGYLQISLEVLTRTRSLPYLYNQSILFGPDGQLLWTYNKTYPVPYDEAFATFSGPGILPVVQTPYGRLSTAICYDTYFQALIRQAGETRADILLAPTNDVRPYASSAAAMAVYRAVENGVGLVRPTGSGLSLIVDPEGRTIASQDFGTPGSGILMASLPIHGVWTLYSVVGDLFAYLCAASLAFLVVWVLLQGRKPTREAENLPAAPALAAPAEKQAKL